MKKYHIPLFNRFEAFKRIKEAKVQLFEQEITFEGEKQDLYRKIQETYLKIADLYKIIEVSEYVVLASDEYYTQMQEKYLIGKPQYMNTIKLKLNS